MQTMLVFFFLSGFVVGVGIGTLVALSFRA
jgi:hypothetical protein